MLFKILRVLFRIVLRVYFRKVIVLDPENLPKDKPLLIASNHPSSFMEACVLACFMPVTVHFMTRGDVFDTPFRWFLVNTNQIPIYRARDGMEALRKNIQSFKWANRLLNENKRIVIFCEGTSKLVKRLRTVQKGTARIAYDALKEYPDMELMVNPVGVNFHEVSRFRSTLIIKIGKPIDPKQYLELDRNEKYEQLTEDIQEGLQPQVVHIAESKNDNWIDVYLKIYHDQTLKKRIKWNSMFDKNQQLIENLEHNPHLAESASAYEEFCTEHNYIVGPSFDKPWAARNILSFLLHIVLAVIAIPAAIIFTPIYKFAENFADKKTKMIEFTNAVKVGVLFGITLPLALITFIILAIISLKLLLIVTLLMIASTWAYLRVVDFWNLYRNGFMLMGKSRASFRSGKEQYEQLSEILRNFDV